MRALGIRALNLRALGIVLSQRARRDRIQVPLWIAAAGLLAWVSHLGITENFASAEDRSGILRTVVANPVILVFRGLPSGAQEHSFAMFLVLPWLMFLISLMCVFLAVRHTRGDEETGRAELIGATTAGRRVPLTATVGFGLAACLAAGGIVLAVFLATDYPLEGSLLAGACTAVLGLVFLGVGLCAAQLSGTARGASSTSVWILLVLYFARGAGNAMGEPNADLTRIDTSWLALVSPFGWAEQSRPFDEDSWPWLAPCLGLALLLMALAYALHAARDLGGALIPERRGPARASALLGSSAGLVWRLARGALLGWTIGALLVGALTTGLASVVDDASADVPAVDQMLQAMGGGQAANREMIIIFTIVVGVLAACYGVQTMCRARQEEIRGTAEAVRTGAVGRVRWLVGFLAVTALGMATIVAAAIAGAALGALRAGEDQLFQDALVAIFGQVPAATVFVAAASLVLVLLPRLSIPLSWGTVLVALLIALFGPLLQAPDWLTSSSPFAVSPIPVADGVDERGLWTLVTIAIGGLVLALTMMRRRELATTG